MPLEYPWKNFFNISIDYHKNSALRLKIIIIKMILIFYCIKVSI